MSTHRKFKTATFVMLILLAGILFYHAETVIPKSQRVLPDSVPHGEFIVGSTSELPDKVLGEVYAKGLININILQAGTNSGYIQSVLTQLDTALAGFPTLLEVDVIFGNFSFDKTSTALRVEVIDHNGIATFSGLVPNHLDFLSADPKVAGGDSFGLISLRDIRMGGTITIRFRD